MARTIEQIKAELPEAQRAAIEGRTAELVRQVEDDLRASNVPAQELGSPGHDDY